jgi:hypothetical protein
LLAMMRFVTPLVSMLNLKVKTGLKRCLETENSMGLARFSWTALLLEKKQIVGSRKTVELQRLTAGQVRQQAAQ